MRWGVRVTGGERHFDFPSGSRESHEHWPARMETKLLRIGPSHRQCRAPCGTHSGLRSKLRLEDASVVCAVDR